MATIKASSFLDSDSLSIIRISSISLLENKTLGKDFEVEVGYTASSFNSMSIGTGVVLTVGGNLEVINI